MFFCLDAKEPKNQGKKMRSAFFPANAQRAVHRFGRQLLSGIALFKKV